VFLVKNNIGVRCPCLNQWVNHCYKDFGALHQRQSREIFVEYTFNNEFLKVQRTEIF
jgi:hypothetical protein